jgi:DNA replication protein DnaC
MSRLKETLDQIVPPIKSLEPITQDYSSLPDLTPEEEQEAILEARKRKLAKEETERYAREYWNKLTTPLTPRKFAAEELRKLLHTSKTASGKRYIIDSDNQTQVNALCLYFAEDLRMAAYGLNPDKGLLIMGPLGCGKSHLLSFFVQNQKASYSVKQCKEIQQRWKNAQPNEGDRDEIEFYSNFVDVAINANVYGHQKFGVCFDDLGTEESPTIRFGERNNVMESIILARYQKKTLAPPNTLEYYHTHFTTNLNKEKIIEKYGDRVYDRLKEMCNVIVFNGDAKSRRS